MIENLFASSSYNMYKKHLYFHYGTVHLLGHSYLIPWFSLQSQALFEESGGRSNKKIIINVGFFYLGRPHFATIGRKANHGIN